MQSNVAKYGKNFSLLKEVRGVLYALDIPWSQRTEEAIKVYNNANLRIELLPYFVVVRRITRIIKAPR
jgi:hypothetical protein